MSLDSDQFGGVSLPPETVTTLPCVWLGVGWVGLDPTQFLGTEPTRPVFGCISNFWVGVNMSGVWLKELEIWVGCHDNPVSEDPT
jgi:hypothetical protein